jgi:transcription elongation factor Elf1
MLYVDLKFISQLSTRLRNFKHTGTYTFNFSCPFCGDSKKNKLKARGYVYQKKTDLFYKCHNCGVGANAGNLIKHVDDYLYRQYVLERYQGGADKHNSHNKVSYPETKPVFTELKDSLLDGLRRIDTLPLDHPARKYVESRLIPKDQMELLYYCPKWKKFVNQHKYTYTSEEEGEHPRLVIPFFNEHGKVFAFQGRAFGDEAPRYMTIKLDEMERIFGLERVNFSQKVYAVEGPLDSLFLPNSIAVAGSSFTGPYLKGLASKLVVVFDNEPRNKDLCKQIGKCIEEGYTVSLMPETGYKDINDLVKAGWSVDKILTLIDDNTVSGLEATARFNQWKKIGA